MTESSSALQKIFDSYYPIMKAFGMTAQDTVDLMNKTWNANIKLVEAPPKEPAPLWELI